MTSPSPVVRAVTVDIDPERAFAVFTDSIVDWWPLATHATSERLATDLLFDEGVLVEVSPDGERSVWGTVTVWDPPRRLSLTWSPSGGPVTTVSVDFEGSGQRTRVVLRHDGWQAYGDQAAEHRASYDGEYAWGWVLDLYARAARSGGNTSAGRGAGDRGPGPATALRGAYEDVARTLEGGRFADPEPGQWNARQVAGHVATNAELMCDVVDAVVAGRRARLYGPRDHAAEAVGRYDGVDFGEIAADLRRRSADLVARYAGVTEAELATPVSTYIEHHGDPVVDGDLALGELFTAEIQYHLPAHADQIRSLAVTESAVVD